MNKTKVFSAIALLLVAILALSACGGAEEYTTERHSVLSGTVKAEFVDRTTNARYLHLTFYQLGEYNVSFAFGPDEQSSGRSDADKNFIPSEQHVTIVTVGQTVDIQAANWPTWFNVTVTNLTTGENQTVEFCSAVECYAK